MNGLKVVVTGSDGKSVSHDDVKAVAVITFDNQVYQYAPKEAK